MIYRFDIFEFDTRSYQLSASGEDVHIEPQVAQILELLITNHGRLVERDEIQEALWADRLVTPSLIDNRIRAARSAIQDDGRSQRLIKTFPNKGYMFVGEVTEDVQEEPPPIATSTPKRRLSRPAVFATAILVSMAVVVWQYAGNGADAVSAATVAPEIEPQELSENRIAVLNFSSASASDASAGENLSRKTIAALSNLPPFGVVSQRSSLAMDKENETLEDIASVLGAAYLLDGTISSDDFNMTATIELVSVDQDKILWADTFAASKSDQSWLEFETEVAKRVVEAIANCLGVSIEGHEQLVLSPEALQQFEEGLPLVESERADEIDQSVEHLTAVVREEPNFILGHMYLSVALENAVAAARMNRDQAIELVKASNETVSGLSSNSVELHMIRGVLARLNLDSGRAMFYFQKVLDKKPEFRLALLKMAKTQLDAFRYEEALKNYKSALSLDPLSSEIALAMSEIYFSHGRTTEAMDLARRVMLWEPNNVQALALSAEFEMGVGNYVDAMQLVQKALRVNPNDFNLQFVAYQIYNALDLLDELDAVLTDPGLLGMVSALRGDRDRAFALARQDQRGWTASYVAYLFGDSEAIYEVLTRLGISDAYLNLKKPILIDQFIEAAFLVDALHRQSDPKAWEMKELVDQYLASKDLSDLQIQEEFSGIAGFYAITGQLDKALEIVDEANRRKIVFLSRLRMSPHFENLRAVPEFKARYETMRETRDQLLERCAELTGQDGCFAQVL